MRPASRAAASRDSGLGPQLGSGTPMPHFCVGFLLGDAGVDPTGSQGASLHPCQLGTGRVSSGVLAPEPRVPHKS